MVQFLNKDDQIKYQEKENIYFPFTKEIKPDESPQDPKESEVTRKLKKKIFTQGVHYLQTDNARSAWVTYKQKLITPEGLNENDCYPASKYDGLNRI
tara:strand:- start:1657 stop:1947 length:291 start_codon:yes stop_codon:yes gene_type:complete